MKWVGFWPPGCWLFFRMVLDKKKSPVSQLYCTTMHCINKIFLHIMVYVTNKDLIYFNLLRDGEDSFSCMWIPCPGGLAGSSSTMSPHEVLWRHVSRATEKKGNLWRQTLVRKKKNNMQVWPPYRHNLLTCHSSPCWFHNLHCQC